MSITERPCLHQDWIDPHAFGIVKALQRKGFTTYLVGGCVRDLLLGLNPKDFDIGTTAPPQEVRKTIYNSYIIGKRFRLVLVKRDQQQYEVATFRRESNDNDGEVTGDNLFGTPEEDAKRRDFTINALFYDPVAQNLIDYCDGQTDLDMRLIRMIGDPLLRLEEDPIRILRAIRLAHKLGFSLEPELRQAILDKAHTLTASALPRRREELLKVLRLSDPALTFLEFYDLGVLRAVAPTLHQVMEDKTSSEVFLSYMHRWSDHQVNTTDPIELFGFLILAYLRARFDLDAESNNPRNLFELKEVQQLLRDELGVFRYEQAKIAKAIRMQSLLIRTTEFSRRGERRQMAMLGNEAFDLAIKLAEKDYSLPPQILHFWRSKPRPAVALNSGGPRPRRRRRRFRGKSNHQSR